MLPRPGLTGFVTNLNGIIEIQQKITSACKTLYRQGKFSGIDIIQLFCFQIVQNLFLTKATVQANHLLED
jgi:hypothetical protein